MSNILEAVRTAGAELLKTLGDNVPLLSRMSGEVRRYHAWHISRDQTVADHTWHVMRLYVQLWGSTDGATLESILFHDEGEMIPGDMQHPVKRYVPALKEVSEASDEVMHVLMELNPHTKLALTARIRWRIKVCDLAEMYEFATRELMAGNHGTGHAVRFRILKALRDMATTNTADGVQADMKRVLEHVDAVDKWLHYRAA